MNNIQKLIVEAIDKAIVDGKRIRVRVNSTHISAKGFSFYTDTCGQREATLKISSYSIPEYSEDDLGKGFYTINRVLSFENSIDNCWRFYRLFYF
jgi:hypothetical protein